MKQNKVNEEYQNLMDGLEYQILMDTDMDNRG